MRKFILIPLVTTAVTALIMVLSLGKSHATYYRTFQYVPVYMERSELEQSVKYETSPRDMVDPGKIYVKDNYIYINERYKGIHVIDNSNPRSPRAVGYLIAPGCIDMAVKGNVMYLDNAVDLVAFNLDTKKVTSRLVNYFPERTSPDGSMAHYYYERPKGYILVGWEKNPNYK